MKGPIRLWIALSLILAAAAIGQSAVNAASEEAGSSLVLDDITRRRFTGDLDAMVERRLIRVLVTYSKTHYFVDRGTQRGLTYEVFRLFEEELNTKLKNPKLRIHVVFIPVARNEIIPALIEGRGDIAAANLTITPKRLAKIDFSDPTGRNVSEIVVTGPGTGPIGALDDLSGKEVYVRKSSSYQESLKELNAGPGKRGKAPVKVRFAPEELESEDILEMVNAGLVNVTIMDSHIASFWKQILTGIVLHPDLAVRTAGEIGWMIRKNSPQLKAELNKFIARHPVGSKMRNILLQKYLKKTKFAKNAISEKEMAKFEATVALFRKFADKYDLDYLLAMAQAYQESGLDQTVRSPVGAIGVMQVMPATGKEMNVGDINKIGPNVHAGVKYMRFMMDHYFADEPMDRLNKGLFALAAYNAGPGRVSRLRRQAAKRGLDPNRWFNHVELVAAEKIGRETVQYVSNIYKYYLAYKMVVEQRQARAKAKQKTPKAP